MTITTSKLKQLREEINAALKSVGERHDIEFRAANAKFDSSSFTFQLKGSKVNADGTVETEEVSDFKRYASAYGLTAHDFGRVFTTDQGTYKICGLKPSASKYPILAHALGNPSKVFKFPASLVLRKLGTALNVTPANAALSSIDMNIIPEHLRKLLENGGK